MITDTDGTDYNNTNKMDLVTHPGGWQATEGLGNSSLLMATA